MIALNNNFSTTIYDQGILNFTEHVQSFQYSSNHVLSILASLSTANDKSSANTKRFRDIIAQAKRTAIDDYLETMLGGQKRSSERTEDRDALNNNLREDLELLMYARKLETLFIKYVPVSDRFGAYQ